MAKPIVIYRSVDINNFVDIIVDELNKNGIACELEPVDTETSPTSNGYTVRFQGTWARLTFTYGKNPNLNTNTSVGMAFSNMSGYQAITKQNNISELTNISPSYNCLSLSILRNTKDFWLFNITIHAVSVPYPIFISSYSNSTGITIGRIPYKENGTETNEFICNTVSANYYMFKDVDTSREYAFGTGDATVIEGMKKDLYMPEGDWFTLDVPAIAYAYGQSGSTTFIKPVELPGLRTLWANGMPTRRPVKVNGKTYYKLIESSSLAVELYPEETL